MAQTVVGVFDTHAQAVRGLEELRREGFSAEQISIFAPDPREAEGYAEELGVRVVQCGGAGIAAGGVVGGLSGWLIGLTGLIIPGAGFVLAAGPIAGALVGAAGGATVGGFIGILAGLGLPRRAAEEYNRELMAGRTLVMVHPNDDFALADAALGRARPLGIHRYDEFVGRPDARGAQEGEPPAEHLDEAEMHPTGGRSHR